MDLNRRMRIYENTTKQYLASKVPVIIKVKGNFFNKITNEDEIKKKLFKQAIEISIQNVIKEMEGFKLAYSHNDEVIFLITDYDKNKTQSWVNYDVSRIVSIVSAKFNMAFNNYLNEQTDLINRDHIFQVKCFNISESELVNYFLWRGFDCQRNFLQNTCRMFYNSKEMYGKNLDDIVVMLNEVEDFSLNEIDQHFYMGSYIKSTANNSLFLEKLEGIFYSDILRIISGSLIDTQHYLSFLKLHGIDPIQNVREN